MKKLNTLFILLVAAIVGFTVLAADVTGPVRYRQGASISFDPQVTLKDEDGAWSTTSGALGQLLSGDGSVLTNLPSTITSSGAALAFTAGTNTMQFTTNGNLSIPYKFTCLGIDSQKQSGTAPLDIWTNTAANATYWTNRTGYSGYALIGGGSLTNLVLGSGAADGTGVGIFTNATALNNILTSVPIASGQWLYIGYSATPTMRWIYR